MIKTDEINSFRFLPDSMTVIERFEENDGHDKYFMPIEECGRAFILACVRMHVPEYIDREPDDFALYEVNQGDFCNNLSCEVILISKKFLYDELEKTGLTPEQDSFKSDEKQKVLQKVFYSALG